MCNETCFIRSLMKFRSPPKRRKLFLVFFETYCKLSSNMITMVIDNRLLIRRSAFVCILVLPSMGLPVSINLSVLYKFYKRARVDFPANFFKREFVPWRSVASECSQCLPRKWVQDANPQFEFSYLSYKCP